MKSFFFIKPIERHVRDLFSSTQADCELCVKARELDVEIASFASSDSVVMKVAAS